MKADNHVNGLPRILFVVSLAIMVIAASASLQAQAASTGGQASAVVAFEDQFSNPTLNPLWHWYQEDPTHWSLTASPGYLRIVTQTKDTWNGRNDAPLLLRSLQPFAGDDFYIQTRIAITPTANFQQGGLVIYADDDNSLRLTYGYIDGLKFEFAKEIASVFEPIHVPAPAGIHNFHLRIAKRGANYSAYYSQDGATWTWLGTHLNINISPLEGGVLAFNGGGQTSPEIPADFDYFRVVTGENYAFEDVPPTYWAWSFIERLYSAGITGGCAMAPLQYCPEGTVTRAQMAVFLLRGIHTSAYTPPPTGPGTGFGDVPSDYWAAAWIKQLAAEGITSGCGNGNYCPEHPVTRAQMAVFLLRSEHGASYNPPGVGAGTGFGDVPPDYWAAAWIKQLVTEGITTGCGNGNYCPEQPVTRAQMAVFLVRTFSLP